MSTSVISNEDEEIKGLKKELTTYLEKKRTKESQLCPLLEKLFLYDIDINEWHILVERMSF